MFAPHLKEEEEEIVLYTNPISNVARSVKTLLNIAAPGKFTTQNIDLFKGEHKQEAYTKINPMSQVPAIMFGDRMMNESNSIMRFLAVHFASLHNLYPADPKERHRVDTLMDLQGNMVRPQFLGAARKVVFP